MIGKKTHTFDELLAFTEKLLLASCHERGFVLTGDLRVSEHDAAALIGISPNTLKQRRLEGKGPASYCRGVGGGTRRSYKLSDLANWLERERENF